MGAREISSYDSLINDNEYRIAIRTGYYSWEGGAEILCDFHFMIQTNTGQWAEKSGNETRLHPKGLNPGNIIWRDGNGEAIYSSSIVYLAIEVDTDIW